MSDQVARSIKIVLADDHRLILEGVGKIIERSDDIEVVGTAWSGSEAFQLITRVQPDVAILDISMPDGSGISVARHLGSSGNNTPIIFLSAHDDPVFVRQAMTTGAKGYVLKRSVGDCLLQAIRAVSHHGSYVDPSLARHLGRGDGSVFGSADRKTGSTDGTLTGREREVVRLVAFGFTNKEVAAKLGVTSKSVETYKMRASEKLNLRSRTKIVQYAFLQGWLQELPH